MSTRAVAALGLALVASGVMATAFREVIPRISNLYPQALPKQPYFVPAHAALLYLAMPLVVIAALALLLAPGIFLVLAGGRADRLGGLVVKGFGASFLVQLLAISAVKVLSQAPMTSTTFLSTALALGALTWGVLAVRIWHGALLPWPLADPTDRRRLWWLVAIPVLTVVLLLPVIYWQDLNEDGFEALEIGRSLASHILPRFPNRTGFMGLGVGMIPMAYPVHWFLLLFGPVEAAARLPLALYLPVLFVGLVALIEWRSPRRLRSAEEAVLVLALAVYVVTMSYNASYDSYFADIAAPTAFETLTVLCMVGAAYFLWTGQRAWFLLFGVLGYLARPTGLLFLVLLGLAVAVSTRENLRPRLVQVGAAIGLCLVVLVAYEKVYVPWATGGAGMGYRTASILSRLQYLKLDDLSRALYVLVPAGILPGLSLLAFRRHDPVGRSLAVVSVAYFLFFYLQAFIALHHFVPVMILPLVVFWRVVLRRKVSWWPVGLAAVSAVLALWASLPRHFIVDRTTREIGRTTLYRIGNYGGKYADHRTAIERQPLLFSLFAPDWEVRDPSHELIGSPLGIIHYSVRPAGSGSDINYIVQPVADPPPAGFTRVAEDGAGVVYVKDLERWRRDRFRSLRTDFRSPIYDIPRETLFRHWGVRMKTYTINLASYPMLWRLF
jgi:hypothetical protein